MEINIDIIKDSFDFVSSRCNEIEEKIKDINDYEMLLMSYSAFESHKTLIEALMSRGCHKDRIYDVLAFYGGCIAFNIRINIEDAIHNAPNMDFHEIKNWNFDSFEMNFLEYHCLTKEQVAQMIQNEKEDTFIFLYLGIHEAYKEFHISGKENIILPLVLLNYGNPLSLETFEYFYLNSQLFTLINEVGFKCCKTIIPDLKISDIHFDKENFEEIDSCSSFLMKSKKLFSLLQSNYFCRSDRSIVFKQLKGIDYETLENYFYSNEKEAFCKYVRQASNYKTINLLCSIFRITKSVADWINGPVQGKYVFSQLFNLPLGSEIRTFVKLTKDENPSIENMIEQSKFVRHLFDKIISNYPSVYKELEDCINPTIMDKIDKIIEESSVCKKILSKTNQKNESVDDRDDLVADASLSIGNGRFNGLLPFPPNLEDQDLKAIEEQYLNNQNFYQLFTMKEKPSPKLIWQSTWSKLEYVIKVMYCGYVNNKDEIELTRNVENGVWKIIVDCFVNNKGKTTTIKSLGTSSWEERLKKHNKEFRRFFIPLLKERKRVIE